VQTQKLTSGHVEVRQWGPDVFAAYVFDRFVADCWFGQHVGTFVGIEESREAAERVGESFLRPAE
jgi:hypothetical protein